MKHNIILISSKVITKIRKEKGLSQESLAEKANLDRTYISGVERGIRNITLKSMDKIISALDMSQEDFFKEIIDEINIQKRTFSRKLTYKKNRNTNLSFKSTRGKTHTLDFSLFEKAIVGMNKIIDQIHDFDVDISAILGMRNLSAFIGELYVSCFEKEANGLFKKNPHQDGYPDLLLMDKEGLEDIERVNKNSQHHDKAPFSPFPNGGIEVKATCGSVPTPAQCIKLVRSKPIIGDQRIDLLRGYDWKAHHRETNNLIGLLWDFIDHKPMVVALFFCSNLDEGDWGEIVQPKKGGGRTTSVSIMSRDGVKKMYQNWRLVVDDDRYISFLNKYHKSDLIT